VCVCVCVSSQVYLEVTSTMMKNAARAGNSRLPIDQDDTEAPQRVPSDSALSAALLAL
jgi:hypothetical protein